MEKNILFFVGKWKGKGLVLGKNLWYYEETTFNHFKSGPVNVIALQSLTWEFETRAPLHGESGFIKVLPKKEGDDFHTVESNYAHPFSLNEFEYGTLQDNKLVTEASKPEEFQRGKTAKGR